MFNDWESRNRQAVLEGRAILERTGDTIERSNQIAIETEYVGTEVVSELHQQRETLLRAKNRLSTADHQLDKSKNILKQMGRNVIYNKIVLVLIIVLEVLILVTVCILKFKPKH